MAAKRVPKKGEYRRIPRDDRQPGTRPPGNPPEKPRPLAAEDPLFGKLRKQIRKPRRGA